MNDCYTVNFLWADNNEKNDDRNGLLVKLIGDRIAPEHGEEFIGAVVDIPYKQAAVVAILGKAVIQDNGYCKVGGYVSARNGIGAFTYKETSARMLKRIDKNHIEILIK